MSPHPTTRFCALLAGAITVAILVGCNGSTGPAGPAGTSAPNTNGAVNAANLTSAQWIALNPVGTISGVTVSSTQGKPVVNFKITGNVGGVQMPIAGLDTFTKLSPSSDLTASYPNLTFTIAKLIPQGGLPSAPVAGAPSKWVNYVCMTTPTQKSPTSVPTGPTTDGNGTLVGHGDGTYTYTFMTDITKVASAVTAYGTANSKDVSGLDPTNLAFDASAPTRVVIEFFGNARGYGVGSHANTPDGSNGPSNAEIQHPINISYDFVPATGAVVTPSANSREIVLLSTCDKCHTELAYHGGHRTDPKNCTICHTDQRRYGATEATRTYTAANNNVTGTFTSSVAQVNGTAEFTFDELIHQIHQGSNLLMAGHDITPDNTSNASAASGVAGEYSINFPQNTANCGACHVTNAAAPQAGNWQTVPSRAACGGCHDNVDFITTGTNHVGGVVTDDSQCATCHSAQDIQVYHTPLMSPAENATNVAAHGSLATNNWQATSPANLPAGAATVSYNILSAAMTSTNNPVLKFQILINGTPAILNPFVPGTTDPTTEAMPTGFAQGPNIALAMGIPQDGITPTDFNYGHNDSASWNLRYIWNKTATTKSGVLVASQGIQMPGAPGTYQIVMDGIQVPPGTQLVALGIGFSGVVQASLTADTHLSNRPNSAYGTTAPNFVWNKATTASGNGSQGTGGLLLPAQTTWASVTGTANGVKLIARRSIIDPSSCNTCHENLGNFTTNGTSAIPSFHGNEFNDGSACVFCHYATGTTGGWTYDAKTWVHALHAGGFRSNAYTAQSNFPGILYPGILNDCEACHVPGSYDFSNSTNAGQISGMLWPTVASGTLAATGNSPWVTPSGNYGATQSFVAPAPATAAWVTAQPANYALSAVTSPITSACGACHDSAAAVSHMTANGGTWYVQRGSVPVKNANGSFTTPTTAPSPIVLASNEQCLVCHGSGGVADIDVVHMNF